MTQRLKRGGPSLGSTGASPASSADMGAAVYRGGVRYNPRTPRSPRAGGGERTIPHADAIAVRDVSKRHATRDGSVAALEACAYRTGG